MNEEDRKKLAKEIAADHLSSLDDDNLYTYETLLDAIDEALRAGWDACEADNEAHKAHQDMIEEDRRERDKEARAINRGNK